MSKVKSIVSVYLLIMAVALSILLIIPLSIQRIAIPTTVYASSQPAHVYQKNTGPIAWADSFDIGADFYVAPQFAAGAGAVIDIVGYMEVQLEGTGTRTTTITYTIYCNGQKVKTASDAIEAQGGPGWVKGGSSIPGIVIPSSAVRSGNNQLLIHADVNSVTKDTGACSFLHRVEKVEIRVQYVGLVGTSNYVASAAVGFFGILPAVIIGKRLTKTKKD